MSCRLARILPESRKKVLKLIKRNIFEVKRNRSRILIMWKLPIETLCNVCTKLPGYSSLRVFCTSERYTRLIYFVFMFLHLHPLPPDTFSPSLALVDCHWAEITPVLLTHLGTRVKHTQGETW